MQIHRPSNPGLWSRVRLRERGRTRTVLAALAAAVAGALAGSPPLRVGAAG